MLRATSLIRTTEVKILLSISYVIINDVNPCDDIIIMLFSKQARGHHVGDPWSSL